MVLAENRKMFLPKYAENRKMFLPEYAENRKMLDIVEGCFAWYLGE